jgi:uncharacterized membrane protein YphA (DoxX/SURF4 family)
MELLTAQQAPWSPVQKFFFRFFCCLFLIYIFPFPLDSFPFVTELTKLSEKITAWYTAIFEAYTNLWHKIIPWVGQHMLHLKTPITIFTNGSGDTTYDYVLILTQFILVTIAAVIWTILDRNRKSYHSAYYWLRVLVRYYLAANMFGYGFAKVFHLQMPFPYLTQLIQPFGDKSPMGLAWSFIGYSKAYSAYTGWGEVVGGALLLFRRTTTLGAIVSAVVMMNVAVLNYCYDIPVKLFSSVLFLMAAFLVAPHAKCLWNILILHKPGQPNYISPLLTKRWTKTGMPWLKWIFILYTLYSNISSSIDGQKQYGDDRVKPPLYGIYNAEIMIRNKDTVAPLITDSTRWKQLVIQFEKGAQVKMMNDSLRGYGFIVDTVSRSISAFPRIDTLNKSKLFYQADKDYLTLTGKIKNDSVYIRLKKYDINKFRLVNRGFRWINEYPFNR